ncbi:hypothetical protein Tco_0839568 [Tanacetum coccineum]|uniref:Uncharacterized protein n=1 Tax=Tanacetum coccineum TaxID=301880 RepID=A0ABQ5AR04_9ASTR
MGDANPICTLRDRSKPSHEGYRNTIELPEGNNVENLSQKHELVSRTYSKKSLIMASTFGSKSKSFMTMSLPPQDEPLTNRLVNDPRDFAKLDKAISLPQDAPSTFDCRLIELEHQVQRLMEAYIALMQPTQRTDETGSRQFAMNQGPRSFNEAANAWKGKPNFNWAYAQTFTIPWNGSFSTYSSNYQTKLEKALILDDTPIRNTAGSLAAQMNFTSTNYPIKEELRCEGIKSPLKLLSPKYLSQSSLAEQNRNPSSPKRVHFVYSIVILNKEDEAKEEGNVKSSTTDYKDHEMIVESKEEFEEETRRNQRRRGR